MTNIDSNTDAFLSLLKAGLWGKEVQNIKVKGVNYSKVYQLAQEQSVAGIVAVGIERVSNIKVPTEDVFQFIGDTLQLEQRNLAMNEFVAKLIKLLNTEDIKALLVKGQGIAQCYEQPLRRACGDVDLLLDANNYENAKRLLIPYASNIDSEDLYKKHLALTIDQWVVELHGTLRERLWKRVDRMIDQIQRDIFYNGSVRVWKNGDTDVFLPSPNNDIILVFTHILKHFFGSGIGLRQICDWCRLLWTYEKEIDKELLEGRIHEMRAITEWKSLAALAVDFLGMPNHAMPLYDSSKRWSKKAKLILGFMLKTGNMGHNRDLSYQKTKLLIVRKIITLSISTWDAIRHVFVFPIDSIRVWYNMFNSRITGAFK